MIPATQARDVLGQAWREVTGKAPPWRALRLALAQSRFEGSWGAWLNANNWGAVQTRHKPPCPAGTVESGDSYPTADGQVKYQVCFKAYPTPLEGAKDFVKHITVHRPKSGKAIQTGDIPTYARALYEERYYGGFGATDAERIAGYEKALGIHAAAVDRALGLPPPRPERKRGRGGTIAAVLATVLGGYGLSKVT